MEIDKKCINIEKRGILIHKPRKNGFFVKKEPFFFGEWEKNSNFAMF